MGPDQAAIARLETFDTELDDEGQSDEAVLGMLDEIGSPATVASAGPRYFGFVTGGAHPIAVASAWLSAAWDQNGAMAVMSPVAAKLDAVAIRWVADLLGLPSGAAGAFVSGATMANATCLAAARDAVLRTVGWDSAGAGLVGAPEVQVVIGAEAHSAVLKALGLVGLGRDRARRLAVDEQGRIEPVDLPELRPPAIVCLQAGNVNSGASDPFPALIDWARSQGAWVHVDGAFGLWAAACPAVAAQVGGVQDADSWATDAHKWLNTTYDCGVALVRDRTALEEAMASSAAYLPPGDPAEGRDPMFFGPQSSQRARGIEVWSVLASLGRQGVSDLVARTVELAQRFATSLSEAGASVLNDVVLNQVVVAFGDSDTTGTVIRRVQEEGTCWCGPTVWKGRAAMRISVSGWSTTAADVDRSVAAICTAAGLR